MIKPINNTIKTSTVLNTKKSLGIYLILGIMVCIFAFIIEKNVSLPQVIIRPIGIISLTALLVLAFFKPNIPFLILVAYAPFARMLVGDFETSAKALNLTNILIFLAIIGCIAKSVSTRNKIFTKSSLNLFIFLFIFWGILSLIRSSLSYGSIYLEHYIIGLKRWLTPVILYFITVSFIHDRDTSKKVVITMMIVTVIIGAMAAKDYLNVSNRSLEESRVGGVFEQSNTLGGFFVYNMFLFLAFFFVYFPNFRYFLLLVPFLICFRGIQVTFSRGAYLGCFFGGVATTFFKSKILFTVTLVFLIFAILNPVFLPAGIRNRLSSTYYDNEKVITTDIEDIKDNSALARITVWKGSIEMIKDHPFFGVGYGLFGYLIPFYAPTTLIDAHNTYLILAAEMGIPALIIFLIILFIMIKNSFWLYRKSKDKFVRAFALGMLGGLFGLLMVNMFGSRLNSEEVSAYFWIYAGLIMAIVNMKKRKIIT